MADGFVLDVQPDPARNEMVLWLKTARGTLRLAEPFTPVVHVRCRSPERLRALARDVTLLPGVGTPTVVEALCGLEEAPSPVLRVPVRDHAQVTRVAQAIDAAGRHRDHEVFDADLRMSHRYLLAKGLWPLAKVRAWTAGRYRLLEESHWSVDYERPPLALLEVGAQPRCAPGEVPTHATPVRRAWVRAPDGEEASIEGGDEESILRGLADEVARRDPDVVLTKGGDAFLLPWLHARAEALGVPFALGREPDPPRPRRAAKSYFSYGKIKHQPAAHVLRGRVHLDRASSFLYAEAGLHGLMDLSRVCRVPLQDLARLGAGTALTAIQVDLAASQGRLVPWKKNVPEAFKTGTDLLLADRGGHIFEPRVGVHGDVVELDFASMYPNLMVNHNISPETILCRCCDPAALPPRLVVPQLGTWTCGKRQGFIPTYLAPVVARREHFKRMRKVDPERRAQYQEACDVYKWLLVTSFGYQGYRNAKFGRIECHEAISAWGRETLLCATEIARDLGWEFLHGIVDALWLKRASPGAADAKEVEEAVTRELGIRFEMQGRYKWVVFLANRRDPERPGARAVGALNRYYGCFDATPDKPSRSQAGQATDYLAGGALKVRGVELRQHSTPRVVREAQERFLQVAARADDAQEYLARFPEAVEAAKVVLRRVLDGAVPLSDLVFTVAVSRAADEYRANTCPAAALRQLARRGVDVAPGEVVRYVVTDLESRDPAQKVVEARLMKGDETYDREAYAKAVRRALESLTPPEAEPLLRRALGQAPGRLPGLEA